MPRRRRKCCHVDVLENRLLRKVALMSKAPPAMSAGRRYSGCWARIRRIRCSPLSSATTLLANLSSPSITASLSPARLRPLRHGYARHRDLCHLRLPGDGYVNLQYYLASIGLSSLLTGLVAG